MTTKGEEEESFSEKTSYSAWLLNKKVRSCLFNSRHAVNIIERDLAFSKNCDWDSKLLSMPVLCADFKNHFEKAMKFCFCKFFKETCITV